METKPAKLIVKADSAAGELISPSERARLEALEEYRFEVRKRLDERDRERRGDPPWWKEKLLAPSVIVIITVALSGYVVPKVLEQNQKAQRVREVTNQLLDEIALNTGEMQVGIESYARAQDTYWTDAARVNAFFREFLIKRDIGAITPDAFEKENELIENDRKRILDRLDVAAIDYDHQVRRFRTWAMRTRVRIRTLYPSDYDNLQAQTLLGRIVKSASRADHAIDDKERLYDDALNSRIAAFKTLGLQFASRKITRQSYQRRALVLLEDFRHFKHVEGPSRDLDNHAIDEAMTILRRMSPVP
jgi:hypothetical protein